MMCTCTLSSHQGLWLCYQDTITGAFHVQPEGDICLQICQHWHHSALHSTVSSEQSTNLYAKSPAAHHALPKSVTTFMLLAAA